MRDLRSHKCDIQRTSWSDLKQINYQVNEETNIKSILGIPYEQKSYKEGFGGGGQSGFRSQLSLENVEKNLVQSGQKLAGSGLRKDNKS